MAEMLTGSRFEVRLAAPPSVFLYVFSWADGRRVAVGWLNGAQAAQVDLGCEVRSIVGADGKRRPVAPGGAVTVSASPCYFELAD